VLVEHWALPVKDLDGHNPTGLNALSVIATCLLKQKLANLTVHWLDG